MAPAKPKPKPAAKPKPPATTKSVTIPNVAFDPEFLRQAAAYNLNYADAHTGLIQQRNQYNQQYAQNMQQLGWDPITKRFKGQDLSNQYTQSTTDLMDDYAARGMGASGAYTKDATALDATFRQRQTQATTARNQFSDNIHQQGVVANNARRQSIENARASAAQTIAAKYGIGMGQVPKTTKEPKKKTVKIPVNG